MNAIGIKKSFWLSIMLVVLTTFVFYCGDDDDVTPPGTASGTASGTGETLVETLNASISEHNSGAAFPCVANGHVYFAIVDTSSNGLGRIDISNPSTIENLIPKGSGYDPASFDILSDTGMGYFTQWPAPSGSTSPQYIISYAANVTSGGTVSPLTGWTGDSGYNIQAVKYDNGYLYCSSDWTNYEDALFRVNTSTWVKDTAWSLSGTALGYSYPSGMDINDGTIFATMYWYSESQSKEMFFLNNIDIANRTVNEITGNSLYSGNDPSGIANKGGVSGTIYVAPRGYSHIAAFDSNGVYSTFTGTASTGTNTVDGDLATAQIERIFGCDYDPVTNALYFAQQSNEGDTAGCIRRITNLP